MRWPCYGVEPSKQTATSTDGYQMARLKKRFQCSVMMQIDNKIELGISHDFVTHLVTKMSSVPTMLKSDRSVFENALDPKIMGLLHFLIPLSWPAH